MWVPINSGIRSGSCSEIFGFCIAEVVRRHSENGISYSENGISNSESCSENTPELSQSSENGLFAPRAFFLKLGWFPGFWRKHEGLESQRSSLGPNAAAARVMHIHGIKVFPTRTRVAWPWRALARRATCGRLIFIHLQCGEVLPFLAIQRPAEYKIWETLLVGIDMSSFRVSNFFDLLFGIEIFFDLQFTGCQDPKEHAQVDPRKKTIWMLNNRMQNLDTKKEISIPKKRLRPPRYHKKDISMPEKDAPVQKSCALRTLNFIHRWRWIVKKGSTSQHWRCIKITLATWPAQAS